MPALRFPFVLLAASLASLGQMVRAEDWPSWRGPHGDGTSVEKHPYCLGAKR